jgi:hypothetical protein
MMNDKCQPIVCAMKKTVKFFWAQWEQTKSSVNRERALKLQSLFERIAQNDDASNIVKQDDASNIVKQFEEVMLDNEIYNKFNSDLWYVLKRQKSLIALKQVVENVIQDNLYPNNLESWHLGRAKKPRELTIANRSI